MSHTPGPWRYEVDEDGGLSEHGDDGKVRHIVAEGKTWTALMGGSRYYPWTPRNEDDWKLIAAAPELLAALKSMVQDDDRLYYGRQPNPDTHGARAAIAKAEGK